MFRSISRKQQRKQQNYLIDSKFDVIYLKSPACLVPSKRRIVVKIASFRINDKYRVELESVNPGELLIDAE